MKVLLLVACIAAIAVAQPRAADLSGCGQFRSCMECNIQFGCAWNTVTGCQVEQLNAAVPLEESSTAFNPFFPVPGQIPFPDPQTKLAVCTELQATNPQQMFSGVCEARFDCVSCTTAAGCVWYQGHCSYSRGPECQRDPINCVNFAWQCPAMPGVAGQTFTHIDEVLTGSPASLGGVGLATTQIQTAPIGPINPFSPFQPVVPIQTGASVFVDPFVGNIPAPVFPFPQTAPAGFEYGGLGHPTRGYFGEPLPPYMLNLGHVDGAYAAPHYGAPHYGAPHYGAPHGNVVYQGSVSTMPSYSTGNVIYSRPSTGVVAGQQTTVVGRPSTISTMPSSTGVIYSRPSYTTSGVVAGQQTTTVVGRPSTISTMPSTGMISTMPSTGMISTMPSTNVISTMPSTGNVIYTSPVTTSGVVGAQQTTTVIGGNGAMLSAMGGN